MSRGDEHGVSEELHHHAGYDPIRAAEREAPTLNTLWLKNGDSQTLLQKVGFAIFSLLFVACGLYLLGPCGLFWRDGDYFEVFLFAAPCAFFFLFGVLGLRNVLHFKHEPD
jgi:hypothetical protein